MGISAPTANAKILYAASFLMIHFTALRHIVVRAANFIVLCDFVSARRCRRPFCRAPWQVCTAAAIARAGARPPPRHPTAIGPGESTYCFRLITNANLTSITGPYTSRTSIVIS